MSGPQQKNVKRAQKEALFLREISNLFLQITIDDPRLREIYINRVALSADKGIVSVFFYTPEGEAKFKELMGVLILYKPSLRAALAQRIPGRYTPELVFRFDEQFEKQQRIENLLEKIKKENP